MYTDTGMGADVGYKHGYRRCATRNLPSLGRDTVAYRYVASGATIVLGPIEASLVRDGGGVLIFYVCEVQSAKAAP